MTRLRKEKQRKVTPQKIIILYVHRTETAELVKAVTAREQYSPDQTNVISKKAIQKEECPKCSENSLPISKDVCIRIRL